MTVPPGTLVLDLDGVVYRGSQAIDGAGNAIRRLEARGWGIVYATNNSTKSPESVAMLLNRVIDIEVSQESVVTSGMAAARYAISHGARNALVIGSEELKGVVTAAGIVSHRDLGGDTTPDAVIVGLDRGLSYGTIDHAARHIRDGATFIATNTDATFPTPEGLAPGAGAIVAAVATASHNPDAVCGKPHRPMLDLVIERCLGERIVMVGDRPETDIAFAKAGGWESILTLSGVTATAASVPPDLLPDHVIPSISSLPEILSD